jgi:hypothetical protein
MATLKEALEAYSNNGAQITLVTVGVLAAVSAWKGQGSSNYGASHAAHMPSQRAHGRSGSGRGSRSSNYQDFTSKTMRRLIAQGTAPKDAMSESARLWRQKTGR